MTQIQRKVGTMEEQSSKDSTEKSSRPVRNKRYTRRSIVAGQRPQKRLFTPEIKRYLKDWLVRRRENPYPNREEKKILSRETGLTYIQICNWFANWRRKLKNANAERNPQTWGHLIRTYNDRAQGNVEQFSISSGDSIWSEPETNSTSHDSLDMNTTFPDSLGSRAYQQEDSEMSLSNKKCDSFNNNTDQSKTDSERLSSPMLLMKWLESAARFQPSESNYSWWAEDKRRKQDTKATRITMNSQTRHDRDEVEAAVALTALATASGRITAL